MTTATIGRAARLLADAWLAGETVEFPRELLPEDRAAAYAIQDEMASLVASDTANAVVGWKVGATSAGVQRAEGYDGPIPGRIFASTVYDSGAMVPLSRCRDGAIEVEIAFRFEAAPHTLDRRITREGLESSVVALPAFDITGTRYGLQTRNSWSSRQRMLAGIADNGNGGAVVLGAAAPHWKALDLMQTAPELHVDCDGPAQTLRGDRRGDPFEALVWMADYIYSRGFKLAAGDVVLTGSLAEPHHLQGGEKAICIFPQMGRRITCQISRA
ncbi:MAG: hypothetical protein OXF76_20225 [Caldilineaceae bacterium]|nr:hypothetical protein [Caldilineaceae bacterium]